MDVGSLYERDLLTARSDESLSEVASRMQYEEVGALPVLDGTALIGIISERDLVRAIADEADMASTSVSEYMTPSPATIEPGADIDEAAATMATMGARHLPVVQDGRVVGIISARDLILEQAHRRT
jgi:CBS domain-containing protein